MVTAVTGGCDPASTLPERKPSKPPKTPGRYPGTDPVTDDYAAGQTLWRPPGQPRSTLWRCHRVRALRLAPVTPSDLRRRRSRRVCHTPQTAHNALVGVVMQVVIGRDAVTTSGSEITTHHNRHHDPDLRRHNPITTRQAPGLHPARTRQGLPAGRHGAGSVPALRRVHAGCSPGHRRPSGPRPRTGQPRPGRTGLRSPGRGSDGVAAGAELRGDGPWTGLCLTGIARAGALGRRWPNRTA